MQIITQQIRHCCHQFTRFLIAVDDKMAAKLLSSQNKSSSDERDSLTPCNMHLTPCSMSMRKILQGYLNVK